MPDIEGDGKQGVQDGRAKEADQDAGDEVMAFFVISDGRAATDDQRDRSQEDLDDALGPAAV